MATILLVQSENIRDPNDRKTVATVIWNSSHMIIKQKEKLFKK